MPRVPPVGTAWSWRLSSVAALWLCAGCRLGRARPAPASHARATPGPAPERGFSCLESLERRRKWALPSRPEEASGPIDPDRDSMIFWTVRVRPYCDRETLENGTPGRHIVRLKQVERDGSTWPGP